MWNWLRKKLHHRSPLSQWSVSISDCDIVTSDGLGAQRVLALSDLRQIVVATDDTGPWGADVVFLLYSDETDPVGIFPLEASGCDAFVEWMSNQVGFHDQELAKAMGSTNVARFTVLEIPPNAR